MFKSNAFRDVPGLQIVAEGLLHDAPWFSLEFGNTPPPLTLESRVDLVNSGLPEFVSGLTKESWGKMSSIDRALLAAMLCLASVQLEQKATKKAPGEDLADRLRSPVRACNKMLQTGGEEALPPRAERVYLPLPDFNDYPLADWTTGDIVGGDQDVTMANGEVTGVEGGAAGGPSTAGGSASTQAPEPGPSTGGGSTPTQAPESGAVPAELSRRIPDRAQSVLGRRSRDDSDLASGEDRTPLPKRRAGSTPVQRDLYWITSRWVGASLLPSVAEEQLGSSQISNSNPTALPNPLLPPAPLNGLTSLPNTTATGAPLPTAPGSAAGTLNSQAKERRRPVRERVKPADPVPRTVAQRREGQQG